MVVCDEISHSWTSLERICWTRVYSRQNNKAYIQYYLSGYTRIYYHQHTATSTKIMTARYSIDEALCAFEDI